MYFSSIIRCIYLKPKLLEQLWSPEEITVFCSLLRVSFGNLSVRPSCRTWLEQLRARLCWLLVRCHGALGRLYRWDSVETTASWLETPDKLLGQICHYRLTLFPSDLWAGAKWTGAPLFGRTGFHQQVFQTAATSKYPWNYGMTPFSFSWYSDR